MIDQTQRSNADAGVGRVLGPLVRAVALPFELRRSGRVRSPHRGQRGAHRRAAALRGGDLRSLLPTIRVPTLVLHRTDDPLEPVASGRFVANGSQARS